MLSGWCKSHTLHCDKSPDVYTGKTYIKDMQHLHLASHLLKEERFCPHTMFAGFCQRLVFQTKQLWFLLLSKKTKAIKNKRGVQQVEITFDYLSHLSASSLTPPCASHERKGGFFEGKSIKKRATS